MTALAGMASPAVVDELTDRHRVAAGVIRVNLRRLRGVAEITAFRSTRPSTSDGTLQSLGNGRIRWRFVWIARRADEHDGLHSTVRAGDLTALRLGVRLRQQMLDSFNAALELAGGRSDPRTGVPPI
jgi:hypothetical protein